MTPRALTLAGLFLLAGLAAACSPYHFRGAAYDPPVVAPDFSLTDMHGQTFHLSDLRGRVVLLTFGYTFCPDVCPATLTLAKQAFAGLGPKADRASLVFVTVDPLRDTPNVMAAFLGLFHPSFIGVTGSPEDLVQVMSDYGIAVQFSMQGLPALGYDADHTARLYLIDPKGRLRAQYPAGFTAEDVQHDMEHVLDGA